jgi:hypothetical protein
VFCGELCWICERGTCWEGLSVVFEFVLLDEEDPNIDGVGGTDIASCAIWTETKFSVFIIERTLWIAKVEHEIPARIGRGTGWWQYD